MANYFKLRFKLINGIIVSIVSLCVLVFSMFPVNAYAYTKSDYNYKDGRYYVDNLEKHTHDNTVTLYLLFPKSSFLEGDIYYDFLCYSDNFPDGSYYKDLGYETLRFHEKLDTAKEKASDVGSGVILSFNFNVENGTYVFSTNDYSYNICTLTKDYKSPLEHKRDFNDETTIWQEKITLNNEHLDLYAIMGGEDFIKENIEAMANYAKGLRQSALTDSQKENNMRDALSKVTDNDTDKDELNLIARELMDESGTESSTEVNRNLDVNKTTTDSESVNITTNTPTVEKETKKEMPDMQRYIYIAAGVIVLIILFIIAKKKKK